MSHGPFISVVIPTCNREQFAIECLASIFGQDYEDVEVLLIDQGPPGRLDRLIADAFPGESRIHYFNVARAGAAKSRNFGVKNARGPVVVFIDDDAIAYPGWLNAIAEMFSSSSRPALMGGRIKPMWSAPKPAWYPPEREFLLGLYDIGDDICPMPENDLPIGANMAGWRETIIENEGFEEQLGPNYFRKHPMITGEETVLGQRIRLAGHLIYYNPAAVVGHRISALKLTRKYFLKRHFWEGVTVVEEMALLGRLGGKLSPYFNYHIREAALAFARFLLPGYGKRYPHPKPTISMLALSRVAYSCGVLYRLRTMRHRTPEVKSSPSRQPTADVQTRR